MSSLLSFDFIFKVFGIDVYDKLVSQSIDNLKHGNPELLDTVSFRTGDGWKGDAENAPFDAIHVGAGADKVPQALLDQLRPGCRLVIPVGPFHGIQSLKRFDKKKDGSIVDHNIIDCRYVPLIKATHWESQ